VVFFTIKSHFHYDIIRRFFAGGMGANLFRQTALCIVEDRLDRTVILEETALLNRRAK